MKRDNVSREESGRGINAQMPQEEKKRHADYLIDHVGRCRTRVLAGGSGVAPASIAFQATFETLDGAILEKALAGALSPCYFEPDDDSPFIA